jgi:hypothetical protein
MKTIIQTKIRRQLLKEWRLKNIVLIAVSIQFIEKRSKNDKNHRNVVFYFSKITYFVVYLTQKYYIFVTLD